MSSLSPIALESLRAKIAGIGIASIGRSCPAERPRALAFGIPAVDAHVPAGGLALGALHEVAGSGPEVEHAAAATLFLAGILARLPGFVLWVVSRGDLFAPALAGAGLHPDRVLIAEAGKSVPLVMEEGLRHASLAAVVGEVQGRFTLTAGRRLHLAAAASGVTAFVLRRSARHDDPALAEPNAAVTRWRIGSLPSPPPFPEAPEVPGLAAARWQVALRARGAEPVTWTMEACDATGHLTLPAEFPDRPAAAAKRGAKRALAG
jgi:protein ImuA